MGPIHKDACLPTNGFGGSKWLHTQCKPIFVPGGAQLVWTAYPSSLNRAHTRAHFVVPVSMACVRSAPATRVNRDGTGIIIRDHRLANYEARLRQEDLALPNPTAMIMTICQCSTGRSCGALAYGRMADSLDDLSQAGEPNNLWKHQQERAHKLYAYARPWSADHLLVVATLVRMPRALGMMRPRMKKIIIWIAAVSPIFLIGEHDTPALFV